MKHEKNHEEAILEPGCEECAGITRRSLLGRSSLAAAAMITAPAWLPKVALGKAAASTTDVLVNVYLRGGMDGLTLCAPYGDPELSLRRPTLYIRPPGSLPLTSAAIDLDGFFGLAPAAGPLLTPFQAGKLLFVHASGLVDPSRSHFDAQKFMELGTTSTYAGSITTGWIARHLQTVPPPGAGFLRGVALQDALPRSMNGGPASLPIKDPDNFTIPGSATTLAQRRATLSTMYTPEPAPLGPAALSTFATIDLLNTINFAGYVPANGAVYPTSAFGGQLKTTAALIKGNVGVEVIGIDYGGWDLHAQLGPITGSMATKMGDLANSIVAFYTDMGTLLNSVTLVAISEFGRRAYENASNGADHGHGNCMLVMGGHIAGGQVLRQWPGLALANLDNGDLQITIDHRDILSEIVQNRLGNSNLATVFPNYTPVFHGITV